MSRMLPQKDLSSQDATGEVVDASVLAALPDVDQVLSIVKHGKESAWAIAYCLTARHNDESEGKYFMKVSVGHHGREALKGEFISTSTIYSIIPDFCPTPIAWGTFESDPHAHFYLCTFHEFFPGMPDPEPFCKSLAKLHESSTSPNGKFGFDSVTYNGNIPQDNTWFDSWEEFFAHGLRHILNLREKRAGADVELNALLPALFDTAIPRLLRPLESDGRKLKPSLVHGDLWCGNLSIVDNESRKAMVYDPASFWAHNEYELGNWRPERNQLTTYIPIYQSQVPASEPRDDFDDRNALYAIRYDLHAATMFPEDKQHLSLAVGAIARLNGKFAGGCTGVK